MLIRIVLCILCFAIPAFASPPTSTKYNTTAVILDLNTSKRTVINAKRADERLSPCSTFKILNSIISLDTKAVKDENETIKWDGTVREYAAWNRDHSMRSAVSVSTVWFYQELARRVGAKKMGDGVKAARYGNMDTSKTLTDFWLGGGSLKNSANEQVEFLAKMLKNELPFSVRSVSIAKEIMTLEKKEGYVFGGKTGSCGGVGWFVGFVESNANVKVFAFNIKGEGANGAEAKKIAVDFLKTVDTRTDENGK
jgi:beta-lactamase class D